MSRRIRVAAVVVPVIFATVGTMLLPASATSSAATRTVARSATFHTDGQSLWGPAPRRGLSGDAPFFEWSWSDSGSVGEIVTICIVPILVGCLEYAKFGAKLSGSTNGRVGLGAHYELGPGSLAIDYPARLTFEVPRTFTPGAWASIASSSSVLPGARILTESPGGHIDLNGVFGFYADAKAEACVVDCDDSTSSVNIPQAAGTIFTIDNEKAHHFSALQLEQLGLSGYVQLPDLAVGATEVKPDGSLAASGTGTYAELGISAIEWALKLSGVDLPLNFDLPLCCGMSAGYTTFDSTYTAVASATQALRFVPRIRVTLVFPKALSYVVHRRNGATTSGRDDRVSFWAGEGVDLKVPANQARPLSIEPRARINTSTLRNRLTTDVTFGGEVEALEAHVSVPSYPPVFSGVSATLGPVWNQSYPIAAIPTIDVWSDQWRVPGFSSVSMKPFVLAPA